MKNEIYFYEYSSKENGFERVHTGIFSNRDALEKVIKIRSEDGDEFYETEYQEAQNSIAKPLVEGIDYVKEDLSTPFDNIWSAGEYMVYHEISSLNYRVKLIRDEKVVNAPNDIFIKGTLNDGAKLLGYASLDSMIEFLNFWNKSVRELADEIFNQLHRYKREIESVASKLQ